ncbi:MAG TPA: poly-gamma-glutamate hydrolase family protein, partial [Actinomycetota bacterium]|nr:poly-gamma-glutamate hydrolase family protein [Actinomycetota bacterium]
RALAGHVAGHLRAALPGYTVEADLADIPKALRGLHPDNPVNRSRGGGVQIELPPRIRLQGPNADPVARQALVAGLAAASSALTASDG